ncbi:MAG TPA: citrate/2-methylcitrate synthase, partial [Euzebya sp.]|nr:citrate/2-methylcitrate synthase [Euzebya sp.]
GVKPATVYAYVSRGQLRSRRTADGRHTEIPAADVQALGRRPARPVSPAVKSGATIRTAITAITDRGPAYRGHLAVDLAGVVDFERVAELLWTGSLPEVTPSWEADPAVAVVVARALAVLPGHLLPIERLRVAVALAAAADDLRGDLRPSAVTGTARGLMAVMAAAVEANPDGAPHAGAPGDEDGCGGPDRRSATAAASPARLAAQMAQALHPGSPPAWLERVVDAAMVLLADHEMAVSAVAARVAASARADPYAVVAAGLAAGSGTRHAGASLPIERWLGDWLAADGDSLPAIRGGDRTAGFGHAVYTSADPRAARLLTVLSDHVSGPAEDRLEQIHRLLRRLERRGLPPPNIDLALAAVGVVAGMRPGAGEAIFVVARTAGWIAHAVEEYDDDHLIRPRALYTGPPTVPADGATDRHRGRSPDHAPT